MSEPTDDRKNARSRAVSLAEQYADLATIFNDPVANDERRVQRDRVVAVSPHE